MPTGERHSPYHELKDGLATGGCVVCWLAQRSVSRYLDTISYESVTDVAVRDRLRASRGLCHKHGRQFLEETRDPLGLAIICQDVIGTLVEVLEAVQGGDMSPGSLLGRLLSRRDKSGGDPARLSATLAPDGECPACTVEQEAERRHAGALVEYVEQPEVRTAYEANGRLCLPHFRLSLEVAGRPTATEVLVNRQLAMMADLAVDLGEYIRKSDYRFRHESLGKEKDAPARAQSLLTGEPPSRSR